LNRFCLFSCCCGRDTNPTPSHSRIICSSPAATATADNDENYYYTGSDNDNDNEMPPKKPSAAATAAKAKNTTSGSGDVDDLAERLQLQGHGLGNDRPAANYLSC